MILEELLSKIEKKYPLELQYSWDNSGLNIGDRSKEIKKILLTLEVTEKTVDEAVEKNIDLIISHHPFLFSKINQINKDQQKGKLIYKLIENSIAVYSMHTSYDLAFDGLNDYFFEILDVDVEGILEVESSLPSYQDGKGYGLGRIGSLKDEMEIGDFIIFLKEKLQIEHIRYIGDMNQKVKKIAVVTGSGAEFFERAKELGMDLLITGDMKYHQAVNAIEMGMPVIDCGHYGSEWIFADSIRVFLEENLNKIEILKSENILNPFKEM